MENAIQMGNLLKTGFKKFGPIISEIRGKGLMIGVKLSQPIARDIVARCLENGLITNATDDVMLRLVPPLNIKESHVEEALSIYAAALDVRVGATA